MERSMMPLPTVDATAAPNTRNATKLKNAAQATAQRGLIAPVETMVAIELAATWKPLKKSKTSATATRKTTTSNVIDISGVLEHDAFDDVGHVLAAVGHGLEVLVDLLELDQLARVGLGMEELRETRAQHLVGLGLEPVDLAADLHDVLGVGHVVEELHRLLHLFGAGDADVGEAPRLVRDLAHLVQEHAVRHVLHQVEAVVHRRDQQVDVLAVERGDEGLVQQLHR